MNSDKLNELHIAAEDRKRPQRPMWIIFLAVIVLSAVALFFAWPRASDSVRVKGGANSFSTNASPIAAKPATNAPATAVVASAASTNSPTSDDTVLTVSGYIVNRE